MDDDLSREIWSRLANGTPLHDLALPCAEGRVDLRKLRLPRGELRTVETPIARVVIDESPLVVKNGNWIGLDLSGADLHGVRFVQSRVEDCVFERTNARGIAFRGSSVVRSSFRQCDLRDSMLGGVDGAVRSSFRHVDFSKADLRNTMYSTAEFTDCAFQATRLKKVNFGGSAFTRCSFAGVLEETTFNRTSHLDPTFPPNTMEDVDFTHAKLRYVEFRELDLERVAWPHDEEHILIENPRDTFDRMMAAAAERDDQAARAVHAYVLAAGKWLGTGRRRTVVNRHDLTELGGREAERLFLELFERAK